MIPFSLSLSSSTDNEVFRHRAADFINNTGTGTIRNFSLDGSNELNRSERIDYGRIIRTPDEQAADAIIPSNGTFIANLTEFFWGAEITGIAQLAMDSRGLEQPRDDETGDNAGEMAVEYIYDRMDVRITFITLYSAVFACCFFGKWLWSGWG